METSQVSVERRAGRISKIMPVQLSSCLSATIWIFRCNRGSDEDTVLRRPDTRRESFVTRALIIATISAAALLSSPAFAQEQGQGAPSPPDFSGIWGNPYLYGIEPPLSGPGPLLNTSRRRQLVDVD